MKNRINTTINIIIVIVSLLALWQIATYGVNDYLQCQKIANRLYRPYRFDYMHGCSIPLYSDGEYWHISHKQLPYAVKYYTQPGVKGFDWMDK